MNTKDRIMNLLCGVKHPAKQDRDIVELGMVHSVESEGPRVIVTLGFPKRRDPLAEYLIGAARAALVRGGYTDSEVKAIVTEEEPARKKGPEFDLEGVRNVRHIIGIASGKGGVGKSTVAVNLAIALARLGYSTGLADADVYGPSVPLMTGTEGAEPEALSLEGREWILPIEKYGVKWMSIGYFAQKGQALVWRGPMASNALKQMILQVRWEELDFLLVDMPPGTGDIHISLLQETPLEAAVLVTTPQEVALADVAKGADMFRNKNINRPLLGIVENMAWFTPAEHPDEKYYIFGRDGGRHMAESLGIELIGQIPLVQGIRESGDCGEPAALGTGPEAQAFIDLAGKIAAKLG